MRLELAKVAAARRKESRRVGVFSRGQRGFVGDLPAAGGSGDRFDENCAGFIVDGNDFGSGIVAAVGDKDFVGWMVVGGEERG